MSRYSRSFDVQSNSAGEVYVAAYTWRNETIVRTHSYHNLTDSTIARLRSLAMFSDFMQYGSVHTTGLVIKLRNH